MIAAKDILKLMLGDTPSAKATLTGVPRVAEQNPARHSRFATQHTRKPVNGPKASLIDDAQRIVALLSNEGTETIPLSVLHTALPDRFATPGSFDSRPPVLAKPLMRAASGHA